MPTSTEEASTIVAISREYLTAEDMKSLFMRLDDEVGKKTDNDSLKTSLMMMRSVVDPPLKKPKKWVRPAFYLLVLAHLMIVFGVIAAFFLLPFSTSWYIALPLMCFIFFFSTTRVPCRLTEMENSLRKKLGMKPIAGFVGHYLLQPLEKFMKKR